MSTTKGFSVFLLCCLISFSVSSQNVSKSLSLCIDLFRSLPTYFQAGYTLEPSLIITTKSDFLIDIAAGYSSISKDPLYQNIQYTNEGSFVKLGGRKIFEKNFSMGLSIGYSSFMEKGVITYRGNLFPDFVLNRNQRNSFVFVEPTIAYQVPLSSHFSFIIQFRTSFGLSKMNQPEFPAYSAPGFGQFLNSADSGSNPIGLGIATRFVYKIFNKE
jgi:hypothetical protein